MGSMIKRVLKIAGWFFLWLIFFWTFLLIGLPTEAAKVWIADRLGKGLNAAVSIEELHIGWNLDVGLKGISIVSGQGLNEGGFTIKLSSLTVKPRLSGLIRFKPELDFEGGVPSGGDFSGSYDATELSFSFKEVSFKDLKIAALPIPSATTLSGSGMLKRTNGHGAIEVEIEGIPGGKQTLKMPGGEVIGMNGKFNITVSLPALQSANQPG